jgi:hypothetical protein
LRRDRSQTKPVGPMVVCFFICGAP